MQPHKLRSFQEQLDALKAAANLATEHTDVRLILNLPQFLSLDGEQMSDPIYLTVIVERKVPYDARQIVCGVGGYDVWRRGRDGQLHLVDPDLSAAEAGALLVKEWQKYKAKVI